MNADFVAVAEAIDRVHGIDSGLPEIPLINWSADLGIEPHSADAWLTFEFGPAGEIIPLSISARIGIAYRRFKTLHEIGHFIDGCALPGRGYSSIQAGGLETWRLAVIESRLFARLAELENEQTGRRRDQLADIRRIDELWARSYSQFVAERSADPLLRAGLHETRVGHLSGFRFPLQWDDDDFVSIADAIEALFGGLEWIAHV